MWAHFLFLFQTAPMPQFDDIEEQITAADSIVTTGHLESIDDVTAAALLDDATAASSSSAPDWHWIADVVAAGLPDVTSSPPLVLRRSTSFTTTTFSPITCGPPPSYLLPDGSPDWDLFNRLVEEGAFDVTCAPLTSSSRTPFSSFKSKFSSSSERATSLSSFSSTTAAALPSFITTKIVLSSTESTVAVSSTSEAHLFLFSKTTLQTTMTPSSSVSISVDTGAVTPAPAAASSSSSFPSSSSEDSFLDAGLTDFTPSTSNVWVTLADFELIAADPVDVIAVEFDSTSGGGSSHLHRSGSWVAWTSLALGMLIVLILFTICM